MDNRPIISEKKQANSLHFISKIKDKITNENSNPLLNGELINESEHPHSSSDSIRKYIQTGGENIKLKASIKYNSTFLKFGFIQEPGNELDPRPYVL